MLARLLWVCAVLLTACQSPLTWHKQMTITDEALYQRHLSPSGQWELVLLAEAGWAFAPHTITVIRRATDTEPTAGQLITRFQLYNDGANLRDANCSIRWQLEDTAERVILACDGQEQDTQVYELDIPAARLVRTTDADLQ